MIRMAMMVGILASAAGGPAAAGSYKAGVAAKVITPTEPLWMAGYGSRDKPCTTKRHDLWVKALAIEDDGGTVAVLLTSDLCGIPKALADDVARAVMKATGLKRGQIMLTCSHTHCGPVVDGNLMDMYPLTPEQPERIKAYTQQLRGGMVATILAALKDRKPAKLCRGNGTARFAVNRREVAKDGTVVNGRNPEGPVDHDVPVLRVEGEDGRLKAVVFGYACHNTTMQFFEWCGDYAGFAQIELEKKHPGALALFWIGTGADANPLPRSKIELCEQYGKELAAAVEDVLRMEMKPLTTKVSPRYKEIALDFDTIPGKEKWAAEALSKSLAHRQRAQRLLKVLDDGGTIPTQYEGYPVQVWKFGDELTWVSLGGEVVVDYNRRLKKELAARPLWITAYANNVLAYIPSARVLKEGGYEADSSQVYYGLPTKWAVNTEARIISTVLELAK